jgi:hypothetical protein
MKANKMVGWHIVEGGNGVEHTHRVGQGGQGAQKGSHRIKLNFAAVK